MVTFEVDVDKTWIQLLHYIRNEGGTHHARGLETTEVWVSHSIIDMVNPILTVPERKLGYRFQAAEAAWILSGDNRVATIKEYSSEIAKFSDDGITFFGAYGPKIASQLERVAMKLCSDPESRQAVLTTWRENPPKTKDVPCTISMQWLLRRECLHCIVTMRSSDMWLGYPYDVFNFSMVSAYLALLLKQAKVTANLGYLHLVAGSQHIYAKNYGDIDRILGEYIDTSGALDHTAVELPDFLPTKLFDEPKELVDFLWAAANDAGSLEVFKKLNM